MNAIICEMCGSQDLVKQDGMYVCQHCGTKYTVEEARKLLGTVAIDKSTETEKLLVLARRAREEGNIENAEKYYGLVMQDDPNNWEATFFQVYYKAMQCKIADISSAASSVGNSILSTFSLISDLESEDEKNDAIATVISYAQQIASMYMDVAYSHYVEFRSVSGAESECGNQIGSAASIHFALETGLKNIIQDDSERLVEVQKAENNFISQYRGKFMNPNLRANEIKRLTSEIKEKDPSYTPPEIQSHIHACYIATAVYGSYDCPPVWTLRRYRDETLSSTWYGRAFIRTYYALSPTLVKWFGHTAWFQRLWRGRLDKFVSRLQDQGVANTPYQDRNW